MLTTTRRRNDQYARREQREQLRQLLTIDDLKARDLRAYHAFMDFTEAQTMFWQLSVGSDGDLWAVDYQMDTRVQWIAAIGLRQ